MNSEQLSQKFWQQVPHSELPHYGSSEKTAGDMEAINYMFSHSDRILDLGVVGDGLHLP